MHRILCGFLALLCLSNLVCSSCSSLNSVLSPTELTIKNGDEQQVSISVVNPLWLSSLNVEYTQGDTKLSLGTISAFSSKVFYLNYYGKIKGTVPSTSTLQITIKGTGESKCFENTNYLTINYVLSDEEVQILNSVNPEYKIKEDQFSELEDNFNLIKTKFLDAKTNGILFSDSITNSINSLQSKEDNLKTDFLELDTYLTNEQAYYSEDKLEIINNELVTFDTTLSTLSLDIDSTIASYNNAVESINKLNSKMETVAPLMTVYSQFVNDTFFESDRKTITDKVDTIEKYFLDGDYELITSQYNETINMITSFHTNYLLKIENFFLEAQNDLLDTYNELQTEANYSNLKLEPISFENYPSNDLYTARDNLCSDTSKLYNSSLELQSDFNDLKGKIDITYNSLNNFLSDYSSYGILDCFNVGNNLFSGDYHKKVSQVINSIKNGDLSSLDFLYQPIEKQKVKDKKLEILNYLVDKFYQIEEHSYEPISCKLINYTLNDEELAIHLEFLPNLEKLKELSKSCGEEINDLVVKLDVSPAFNFDYLENDGNEGTTPPEVDSDAKTTSIIDKARVEAVVSEFTELSKIANGKSISLIVNDRDKSRFYLIKKEGSQLKVYESKTDGDIALGIDYTGFELLEDSENKCSKLNELTGYGMVSAQVLNNNPLDITSFCAIKDCVSSKDFEDALKYCW